jgi:type IX secretion system substrate protein
MINRLALIILVTGIFLFTACKKDSQINSPVTVKSVEVISPVKITDSVYPNPFYSSFTIETNSTDSQTVKIIDMMGSIKLTLIINGTTAIADNGLANGVYFLEITNRTGTINKKIIKD